MRDFNPIDWLSETEELETPLVYMSGALNPFSEKMILEAYLALARLTEALGWIREDGHELDDDELEAVAMTVCFTLNALHSTGITMRHPELNQMPEEVPPNEFQKKEGDDPEAHNDRLSEWVAERMKKLVATETFKVNTNWN